MKRDFKDLMIYEPYESLNMYGFMDFSSVPGGENFGTVPCNGLLDQAMALRWVHENIAAFGGDPSTDQIEWKPYSADDQNVLDIAGGHSHQTGPADRTVQGRAPPGRLLSVHGQVLYPHYLSEIVAAREQ